LQFTRENSKSEWDYFKGGLHLGGAWIDAVALDVEHLSQVRVHDLKYTFGRRLRAAEVCFEDRQDLLGHCSFRVTTHYSAPELAHLIEVSNLVCERNNKKPELVVLKRFVLKRSALKVSRKNSREMGW